MIGYAPGDSRLHRAHPYTPLALAATVFAIAFVARRPPDIALVVLLALGMAAAGGALRRALRPALVLALPIWLLLFVVHVWRGPEPFMTLGGLDLSRAGAERALVLGGRLTAILVAFLTALTCVSPARLVEAMTARRVPFARMYLLVSTLTLVPRLRERAARILDAQQCRGLRLRGSLPARVRALGPLVLPLVLGALAEVDEQVLALDARGVTSGATRTSLWPPDDPRAERVLRASLAVAVVVLYAARLTGRLP